jgi:penicillin-binding protein 1C
VEGLVESEDFYGPSLALGSADVSLWDMTNAYRTLANGGVAGSLRLARGDGSGAFKKRVFSAEAAFMVSDILSDREARAGTFGLESPLSTSFRTAVKTGTSKDMRDNWCIGYSDKYTVGVWVGNFSGEPMWSVSGVTGAAPLWARIMNRLHSGRRYADRRMDARPPTGLMSQRVSFSCVEPDRAEWFIEGTEPRADIDPDIPEDMQEVFFEHDGPSAPLAWVLDERHLGTGPFIGWKPTKGKHVLALVDENRMVIDVVNFEVRGDYGMAGKLIRE